MPQEAIAQAVQAADQDQDGLVSSLELQNRKQELQKNGDIEGAYLLNNVRDKLDIAGPDQFIQLKDNNGALELKVYNTDLLRNKSFETSTITSTTSQTSTATHNPANAGTSTVISNQTSTIISTGASSEEDLNIDALQEREKVLDLLSKADLNQDGSVNLDEMKNYRSSLQRNPQNAEDMDLLDSLLTKDQDGISNFIRLHSSYGWGSSVPISKIQNASRSWERFIEIYKTGQTFDPLGELGVVSK